MKIIERNVLIKQIQSAFKSHKIVALLGPRQVGKTTLSKIFAKKFDEHLHVFDLEDPTDEKILENPKLALAELEGLIIIDEIQRNPKLFPYLRVKADTMNPKSRILLLGSSSRDLINNASESLAGRICYIEVSGFSLNEVGNFKKLLYRGGLPPSYLARTDKASHDWRNSYIRSFIERDLKSLGLSLPPATIRRFMEMLLFYHGQIFNASEISSTLGFSHTTAMRYIDILCGTFLLRELKPWHESIMKRQVKMSKLYIRDTGIALNLLGIKSPKELMHTPKMGALWEGFAIEEIIKHYQIENEDLYFWSTHQGAELDLFWKNGSKRIGFEMKYADAPAITKSMRQAIDDLKLDKLYIVYPGEKSSKLDKKIELLGILSV